MSRKRDKKGFLRLNHESGVVVGQNDESESEIELMDMTGDVKTSLNGEYMRNKTGWCDGWCVSLYLLLLTLAVVILSVFLLFMTYNMQMIKGQINGMNQQIHTLEDDLLSFKTQYDEVTKNHTSFIATINSSLTGAVLHLGIINSTLRADVSKLGITCGSVSNEFDSLKLQLDQIDIDSIHSSMATIVSFSSEVSEIHSGLAHFKSQMESLTSQVVEAKKQCGDVVGNVDGIRSTVSDLDDSVTALQTQSESQVKKVDEKLQQLTTTIEGHTKVLQSIHWMTNFTTLEQVANMVLTVGRPSLDNIIQNGVEGILAQLTELEEAVANITDLLSTISSDAHFVPNANVTPINATPTQTKTTHEATPTSETTPIISSTHVEYITSKVIPETTPIFILPTDTPIALPTYATPIATPISSVSPTDDSTSATEDQPEQPGSDHVGGATEPTDTRPSDTNSTDIESTDKESSDTDTESNSTNTESIDTSTNSTDTESIDTGTTDTGSNDNDGSGMSDVDSRPGIITSEMSPAEALQSIVDNFDYLDSDNDGNLSESEFRVVFDNKTIFQQLDSNHDGYIAKSELLASVKLLSGSSETE